MYVAMLGDARKKAWAWGIVMAVGLELFLLITPYSRFFGIAVTAAFIAATLIAHLIFGAVMGAATRAGSKAWSGPGSVLGSLTAQTNI